MRIFDSTRVPAKINITMNSIKGTGMAKQPGNGGRTRNGGPPQNTWVQSKKGVERRSGVERESSMTSEEFPNDRANRIVSDPVLRGTTTQAARVLKLKATAGAPTIEKQAEVREVHPGRRVLAKPREVR